MSKQATSKEPAGRSRAYPVLPLEEATRVIGEILDRLGEGAYGREVLAGILGYSNAHGGPGARKIAALTQFGLLWRRAGLYSPTDLAREVVSPVEDSRQAALFRALRQPPLFRALLDRYQPQGRVPSQLGAVLWRDHGITRKASRAAAETFIESARHAGVLDRDGLFLVGAGADDDSRLPDGPEGDHQEPQRGAPPSGQGQRFEFALSNEGVARLWLPLKLCREDLEIVRRQIDFLEYQVRKEEAHGP